MSQMPALPRFVEATVASKRSHRDAPHHYIVTEVHVVEAGSPVPPPSMFACCSVLVGTGSRTHGGTKRFRGAGSDADSDERGFPCSDDEREFPCGEPGCAHTAGTSAELIAHEALHGLGDACANPPNTAGGVHTWAQHPMTVYGYPGKIVVMSTPHSFPCNVPGCSYRATTTAHLMQHKLACHQIPVYESGVVSVVRAVVRMLTAKQAAKALAKAEVTQEKLAVKAARAAAEAAAKAEATRDKLARKAAWTAAVEAEATREKLARKVLRATAEAAVNAEATREKLARKAFRAAAEAEVLAERMAAKAAKKKAAREATAAARAPKRPAENKERVE
ncbi:hypothetical protein T492DRAFT_963835 [Pavlovales sp. CCMP2436]|nr:hypothetical protein T492DRAFT_963835 [Pavlovales sp. CCMP2436]